MADNAAVLQALADVEYWTSRARRSRFKATRRRAAGRAQRAAHRVTRLRRRQVKWERAAGRWRRYGRPTWRVSKRAGRLARRGAVRSYYRAMDAWQSSTVVAPAIVSTLQRDIPRPTEIASRLRTFVAEQRVVAEAVRIARDDAERVLDEQEQAWRAAQGVPTARVAAARQHHVDHGYRRKNTVSDRDELGRFKRGPGVPIGGPR